MHDYDLMCNISNLSADRKRIFTCAAPASNTLTLILIQDLPGPVNIFLSALIILLIHRQDKTADVATIASAAHVQKKIDNGPSEA